MPLVSSWTIQSILVPFSLQSGQFTVGFYLLKFENALPCLHVLKLGPFREIISLLLGSCHEGLDKELSLKSLKVQASATRGNKLFPHRQSPSVLCFLRAVNLI